MTRYARRSNGEGVVCDASSEIGSGGEARICEVASAANLVAKVYHTPTQLHANKLLSMLANPPDGVISAPNQSSIAWPVDLLVVPDGSQRIAGFLMPRVKMEPIVEFYHPKTRLKKHSLFHYGYLHRTGRNLASAVGTAHARGYVIGDVNESNILANEQALISLVDTDSFQVRDQSSGLIYRCPVGKIEFTPPELQGRDFSEIDRSPHHDAFGLAVLLFQLLMEGTHPFAGRFTGTGEAPSLGRRIKAGHFPYGSGRHSYSPGKHALPFSVLDPSLQALFLRCFEEGYQNPHRRPDAVMWRDALQNAEASLTSCRKNSQHLFGSHLSACPWCDRSVQQSNIDSFPLLVQQSLPIAPIQQPRVALDPVPVIAYIPQLHPQRSQQPKKRRFSLGQGLWKTLQFAFSCILLAALAQWMYHEVTQGKVAGNTTSSSVSGTKKAIEFRNEGIKFQDAGDYNAAVDAYRAALSDDPSFAAVHDDLALAYFKQGKLDEAISEAQESARLDPTDPLVHHHLGELFDQKSQISDAINEYREAIHLTKHNNDALPEETHSSLASDLEKQGDLDGAVVEEEQAIQINPNDYDAHRDLGTILDEQQKFSQAADEYQEAIDYRTLLV